MSRSSAAASLAARARSRSRRPGVRVRLHEAREIAGGASGRNGGFALRGGAMAYDVARTQLGDDSGTHILAADRARPAPAGDTRRRRVPSRSAAFGSRSTTTNAPSSAPSTTHSSSTGSKRSGSRTVLTRRSPDGSPRRSCTRPTARCSRRAGCGGWRALPRTPARSWSRDSRVDSLDDLEAGPRRPRHRRLRHGPRPRARRSDPSDARPGARDRAAAGAPLRAAALRAARLRLLAADAGSPTRDRRLPRRGRRSPSGPTTKP